MPQLRILGQWKLTADDGSELRAVLTQPKRLALLAYLALASPRGFHRRDTLMALFWPEVNEERGRNSLRQAVHHLRLALGGGAILSRGDEELAVDTDRLSCDVIAFERALDEEELVASLELYRGDLLPGLFVPDAGSFERWLETERARLKGRAGDAAWALAEREAAGGNVAAAGHWARWAAALAPDDELAVQRLMILLGRIGDRAGAVRAYHAFERRLLDEDNGAPSARTQSLLTDIEERPPLAPAAAPAAVSAAPPVARLPAPEPAAPAAAPRPRRRQAALLAAGAIVLVLAAVVLWRRQARSAIPVDANAVATFPFVVSGDSTLSYLRDGMVDLLDAGLDGAAGLRTIDPHAIEAALASRSSGVPLVPATVGRLSRQLGARLFILGEVVGSRGHLQLEATLYDDVHDTPLEHASAAGDDARLFRLSDALASQLLADRPEGPDTRLTRAAGLTTKSLDALRAYVDGERAYRSGRYQDAVDAFERATSLDTSFALAWYRLAIARDWTGSGPTEAIAHAFAHADALAPRERTLVGGFWLYASGDPAAERSFNVAVTQHPDDIDAWLLLGESQFHLTFAQGRSFAEARAAFTNALKLDPGNPNALVHLARIAAAEGRAAEVDTLDRLYLTLHPDADRALEMRALAAFMRRGQAERDSIGAALAGAGDVTLDVAARGVAAFVQDLAGAERLAPLYLTPARQPLYVSRGRALAAELALAAGRWGEAQRRLTPLAALDPDWAMELRARLATQPATPASPQELAEVRDEVLHWRMQPPAAEEQSNFRGSRRWQPALRAYLLGLISVRLGDTAGARLWATELDRMPRATGDSDMAGDLAHSIRAEIGFRAGALRLALSEIEQVHFTYPAPVMSAGLHAGAHERFLHAELLHAVGRDEEALRWYASFPEPSGYDITYLAPAYLREGEISERFGRGTEALAFYRRAVSLWAACDAPLRPRLAEAQRAIKRLSP